MGLARQSIPQMRMWPVRLTRHRLLLVFAAALAMLCGAAAFVLLVVRDHGRPKVMVNEQSSPSLLAPSAHATGRVATAPPVGTAKTRPGTAGIAVAPDSGNKFSLAMSNRRVALGPLRLRLTNTDPLNNTYDVSVSAGRRSSTHRNVKANEPLWIASNRGTGAIELVVTLIDAHRVSGYWTESKRSPQVSARVHGRRR